MSNTTNLDQALIPAVISCPSCGEGHIDSGEWATSDKTHKTHLCLACGNLWQPYPFPTVGVFGAVGDIVPWAQVPTHSLVLEAGNHGWRAYTVRLGNRGWSVQLGRFNEWAGRWDSIEDGRSLSPQEQWGTPWLSSSECCPDPENVLIVALDLRGDESADELRDLASKGPKL